MTNEENEMERDVLLGMSLAALLAAHAGRGNKVSAIVGDFLDRIPIAYRETVLLTAVQKLAAIDVADALESSDTGQFLADKLDEADNLDRRLDEWIRNNVPV